MYVEKLSFPFGSLLYCTVSITIIYNKFETVFSNSVKANKHG